MGILRGLDRYEKRSVTGPSPEKMEMGGGEAHLFIARVRSMLPPDPQRTAYNNNAAKAVALQVLPPPFI